MMTEIEKLYENAGVSEAGRFDSDGKKYKYSLHSPFTAEKQIEIMKWILFSTWWLNLKRLQFAENFENSLAELVNTLWQDLTEQEKEEIRGILK